MAKIMAKIMDPLDIGGHRGTAKKMRHALDVNKEAGWARDKAAKEESDKKAALDEEEKKKEKTSESSTYS